MLKSLYEIGKLEVENLNDDPVDKVLFSKTINPVMNSHDKNKNYYEVIMNFNTQNNTIELKLGKELSKENRELFYGFQPSRRGKRIFFSTNNLYYFIQTIPDIIDYYAKEKKYIKNTEEIEQFVEYLNKVKETFYTEDDILNINRLKNSQKKKIFEKQDFKETKKNIQKVLEKYVENYILGDIKLKDISICTLTFDEKRIMETKYSKGYQQILKYNQFYRYLEEEKYKNKICSCCGKEKDVTPKIDYPEVLKLYVITGKNFFYGRRDNKTKRYKHFSLCEECYINTYLGSDIIINNWRYNFLGDYDLRYLLIPKNVGTVDDYKERLDEVGSYFEESYNLNEQMEELEDLKEEAYLNDLLIDFLFYRMNPQGTGIEIEQTFTDVSFNRIKQLIDSLSMINDSHHGIGKRGSYEVDLSFPYHKIFRTKAGRTYTILKKELLGFYKTVLNDGILSYRFILQRFMRMFKWQMKDKSRKENAIWSVYDMQLFLTWVSEVCELRGGFRLESNNKMYFDVGYPKIDDFFRVHKATYSNTDRQALFFLGILIDEILRQQQDKTSNFMSKLKYEGLKKRDITKLISHVTEYLNIYKPTLNGNRVSLFKLNRKIYGLMMDRMQGLEESNLTKDENLFYILSGISFAKNVNYKKKKED